MTPRRAAAIVAALAAIGALVRLPGLDSGLWYDEIVTLVESVRPPVVDLLTAFPGFNNHPLYSLLAHVSIVSLGEHVWTLRLPAFVFGVAAIPMVYWMGAAVTSRSEGVMAALLLTVSYHHVWFSQNARGYTILLVATLLATVIFLRMLEAPRTGLAIVYGVVVGLGCYTHLTMTFAVATHGIAWVWQFSRMPADADRSRHLRNAAIAFGTAGVVTALLYLPMAQQVYVVLSGPRPGTASVATPKWAVLEVVRGLRIGFGALGVVSVLALLGLGAWSYLRTNLVVTLMFVLPGVIGLFVMIAAGMTIRPRFFLSLLGFGLLMLVRGAMVAGDVVSGWGILGAPRRTVGIALVGLIAVVSTFSLRYNYQYPKQDFEGPRQFVERMRQASEPVATAGLATYPYTRYYQLPWIAMTAATEFDRLRERNSRAWVIYSFEEYMDRGLVEQLHEHCPVQQIFPGTLGGGDVIVCAAAGSSR